MNGNRDFRWAEKYPIHGDEVRLYVYMRLGRAVLPGLARFPSISFHLWLPTGLRHIRGREGE